MNPHIEILFIGTELLTGKLNTHIRYFGERLAALGLPPALAITVGDDRATMVVAFQAAIRRSDVVICTGGLGPTFDDLTVEVMAKVLKRRLVFQPAILREIQRLFAHRGIPMPEENRRQAYLIEKAIPIPNRVGTAPGQLLDLPRRGTLIALLPGPSSEMEPMAEQALFPLLRRRFRPPATVSLTLRVAGQPESVVDERIQPVREAISLPRAQTIQCGILAHHAVIDVKVTIQGPSFPAVARTRQGLRRRFRQVLGADVFGEDGDTLEGVAGAWLAKHDKTLAVAESCTGGLITHRLTNIPGSSRYLQEGVVTYSNRSKERWLGVSRQLLAAWGAVSGPVARVMAVGIRRRAQTDYGLSVTGIAGPAGGSAAKPVGLVYIGVAGPRLVKTWRFQFSGNREDLKTRMATAALDCLRRHLLF